MTFETQHPITATEGESIKINWGLIIQVLTHDISLFMIMFFIGSFVRLWFIGNLSFILNDGGIIYQMVNDLAANGYRIPPFTFYNGDITPFAHPPLGLYWLGFLDARNPDTDLIALLRWYMPFISSLTVPIVYVVSRSMLRSKLKGFTASLAFSVLPYTALWSMYGSGAVRTTALVVALLAIHQAYLLIARRNENYLFTATLMLSLAFLIDGEMGYFALYSIILILLVFGRNRFSIIQTLLLGVITLVLVSIWFIPAVRVHGLTPYVSGIGTVILENVPFQLLFERGLPITGEIYMPVIAVLGLLGFFVCVAKREWLLPAWIFVILLLHGRSAQGLVAVPIAILASVALHQLVLPLMLEAARPTTTVVNLPSDKWARRMILIGQKRHQILIVGFLATLSLYLILSTIVNRYYNSASLAISDADMVAITWITAAAEESDAPPTNPLDRITDLFAPRTETSADILRANDPRNVLPDAVFAIVTGQTHPENDALLSWFPILTNRNSMVMVSGSAWRGEWQKTHEYYTDLQKCVSRNRRCIVELEAKMQGFNIVDQGSVAGPAQSGSLAAITGANSVSSPVQQQSEEVVIPRLFTHVYISSDVNSELVQFLINSSVYERVFNTNGVQIFHRAPLETELAVSENAN